MNYSSTASHTRETWRWRLAGKYVFYLSCVARGDYPWGWKALIRRHMFGHLSTSWSQIFFVLQLPPWCAVVKCCRWITDLFLWSPLHHQNALECHFTMEYRMPSGSHVFFFCFCEVNFHFPF